MDCANLYERISEKLESCVEPGFKERQQGYNKEKIQSFGVRTSVVRQIAKDFFPEVAKLPLDEFTQTVEHLLAKLVVEHRCIALVWAYCRRKELNATHFERLVHWLRNFVKDWTACDQLCCEVFGDFMARYPQFLPETLQWATSKNQWLRRAAAVVLIPGLRNDALTLEMVFQVSELLFSDKEDLVQKGYGWALKEASELHLEAVYAFVITHKIKMSRTALRYAIEKMSPKQKAEAMKIL